MKFRCTIKCLSNGQWSVRHEGADVGHVEVTAASRDEALDKMRDELRYRLEFCACVGDRYKDLQLEWVETP
jgi:hypothetical protein